MDVFYFLLFEASVGAQAPPFSSKRIIGEWTAEPSNSSQQYNTPVCSSANCNGESGYSVIKLTTDSLFVLPGLP